MKMLYIVFHGINSLENGISKKVESQVKSFNKIWGDTSISNLSVDVNNQYNGRLINGKLVESYKNYFGFLKRLMWRVKFKSLLNYIKSENVKILYIRYTHFANPFFNSFLKKTRKMGVYIIMEIPTFPYDSEYADVKLTTKLIKRIEEYYRGSFKKYIDLIVTYTEEKEIFGVKTIKINNGIDLDTIPLKSVSYKNVNDLHLIAVSSMEFWHGYDRLIEGLNRYYKDSPSKKIYLHLVGPDRKNETLKYKELVEKYNLQAYVVFHGYTSGIELDNLFAKSNIAVGCLAVHRKNIKYVKSLKNSEYCARGIPFLYSEIDYSFENKPFVLKVPANEEPIDINCIIEFYNSLDITSKEIRKIAEEELTWDFQVEKILDFISKDNETVKRTVSKID